MRSQRFEVTPCMAIGQVPMCKVGQMHAGYTYTMEDKRGLSAILIHAQKRKQNVEGDWWSGSIQIPRIAEVVDFVLSDPERNTWENNGNQDFHVRIKGSLSREQLIEVI